MMGAILIDSNTGEPYLDEYNNTVQVDNERGFQQIIDGLFNCELGSEPMNPFYGFDLKSAIREASFPNSEMYIESLVTQALNPQIEKLISKIEYVKADRIEKEIHVTIEVSSVLNDNITTDLDLGE